MVDATGVGAGLASFLDKALPGKVIAFTFTSASKSQLGWDFLNVIDSGRWKEFNPGKQADRLQTEFYRQLEFTQYEIQPGPDKKIKWSVPDGTRDPATGELLHDDLVMSAALVGELEAQQWAVTGPTLIVQAPDPLADLDRGF